MSKQSFKEVTVISYETVSPNILRLSLQGAGLKDFPEECESGYIKLLFTAQGKTNIGSIPDGQRPVMRTYTIRRFDPINAIIEVDFVKHITDDIHCGFAARWAMNARVGDKISISGPGMLKDIDRNADWFFFIADMTALPALSVKLQTLPKNALGYAVIKVASKQDIQALKAPKDINITWLVDDSSLEYTCKALPWLTGQVAVWCACEFDSMRSLRQYFNNERLVSRDCIYISSYWKQGVSEDGHKVLKRQDAEALAI
jgi:NADPH-dependent ferric siderophore reductase